MEKKTKSVLLQVTFARRGNVRPKFLEHSFVKGFAVVLSLSFSDLWACFDGGFQTKNGAMTFDLGSGHVS